MNEDSFGSSEVGAKVITFIDNMAGIESGGKIPEISLGKERNETFNPYKKGLEEILKLPMFEGVSDVDYVDSFQKNARVTLQLRNEGPSPDRLLEKSISEMSLKNFKAGAEAAHEASVLSPDKEEAHFEEGKAKLLFASQKANAIQGIKEADKYDDSTIADLLKEAKRSFTKAVKLDPDDEEAKEVLEKLTTLLDSVK